jgi:L-fuculose-phosphate aldolase
MTMTDDEIRLKIAMSRRILAREGCESKVAGHVSMRAPGEDAMWVSPFSYFDETLPEQVIKCTLDLQLLDGDWEPSPAIRFHAQFYKNLPHINSVIHTHSHYAEVFSTTNRLLGMYNDKAALFLDEQVIADDNLNPEDPVNGDRMSALLGNDKHVIIAKNHGAIFLQDTLENATVEAFTFEDCCQIQIEAEQIGGTEHSRAYVERGKKAYHTYYRPQMWAACVRRLKRDEPDLFLGRDLSQVS